MKGCMQITGLLNEILWAWDLGLCILISFPGDYYADTSLKTIVYNASEQKHDLLLTVTSP